MRVAHFDPFSGVSGDMMLGALIDVGVDPAAIERSLALLDLPIQLAVERVQRGGFACTRVKVLAPDEASHRHLPQIQQIITRANLPERQHKLALAIFQRLAEAEATVHGKPIEKVHFHEVGALDSIADIVGSAVGLDLLGVEEFTSSPVATGSGTVKCEHGIMPVPTPATALLLKGVPLAQSTVPVELATPTGAAILTTVVKEWVPSPAMIIERIGHGGGSRDLPMQPNVLRLLVGTSTKTLPKVVPEHDRVWVLETNIDDAPAEFIGFCFEQLLAAGALDVFSVPIQMKKNRPGVLLTVIAAESLLPRLEAIIFRETATFGIRRYPVERTKLQRDEFIVHTRYGDVRGKRGWREGQAAIFTPEYDDCARIAQEKGVALREVYREATAVFAAKSGSDRTL